MANMESKDATSASSRCQPSPMSSRGGRFGVSATNPEGVGVASSSKGATKGGK